MSQTVLPKILVVDDTPANLLVMRRLLAKAEVELIEAASGPEALSACIDHEFALILLDVNMPEMDGFETASLIGEAEKNRLAPIIFVTAAYADDLNRLKGYHAGAVDYIAKPINDQILRSKVRVFIELWRARQELRQFSALLNERNHQLEHEVAERKRAESEARHQATHDALTGLPNRLLFLDRLQTAIERGERNHQCFAVLYIDIDGFKPVNDQHGHAMGDVLLQQIAERLLEGLRRSDTVARLGGDEFAVILDVVADRHDALQISKTLCHSLSQPFVLQKSGTATTVTVGASIGLALYPEHGQQSDPLLTAADAAMYLAKRSGKNQCVVAVA